MVLATHEMAFARDVATKVCFLDAGRILEQGPPDADLHRARARSAPGSSCAGCCPPDRCEDGAMTYALGQGTGPLRGTKVVEIAGIGPGPHACMILADLGADVIRVERAGGGPVGVGAHDVLTRGRPSVAVDLKHPDAPGLVLDLVGARRRPRRGPAARRHRAARPRPRRLPGPATRGWSTAG